MNFGTHGLNLALRFALELTALYAYGRAGLRSADGVAGYVLMLVFPLAAAAAWGTFAVPGDPSRSGRAPVSVPGAARLGVELAFFAIASFALWRTGAKSGAAALGLVTLVHYGLSLDRLRWLLER
ncbi:MAG: YrdB family protein [Myxococcales bacterium]